MSRTRVAVFVFAVFGATAGWAEAQPGPPVNRAILETLNSIQSVTNDTNSKLNSIQVTIVTDETVCTGALVQCSGSGHTPTAAATDNHNPVAVILFVTRNGQPVENLPASSFSFETKFAPANGPGIGPCDDVIDGPPDDANCNEDPDSLFQSAGDGVYAFYVHPIAPGVNWKPGMYTFVVRVSDGGIVGRGLGKIVIPPATP